MADNKARKVVELYYDVISPYSWLAFEVLTRYKTRWNMELKLKPFFLGGIMRSAENRAPASVPRKGAHLSVDLQRLRNYYHIPFVVHSNIAEVLFNKGSLNAQRFLTALDMCRPDMVEDVSRELWMRVWNRNEDITQDESFREVGKAVGLPEVIIEDCIQKIQEPVVKDRLKLYTQQALDHGAFGAPTIVVYIDNKPEMFFGSDRFPIIAHIMGENWEGPLPPPPGRLQPRL